MSATRLPSSFRDPSGFVFTHEGVVHRQVNPSCREDYDLYLSSGLHAKLVADGLVVDHEEVDLARVPTQGEAYRVLLPEQVPFISYPYEWAFGALKDAACLTLDIQMRALDHGLWLKDASAYNVQFVKGRPVFIDTLSFEAYPEGAPWVAYQQFCRHFLAPLALIAHTHIDLQKLLRVHIDGVPLDLASRLLPTRTRFKFGLLTHIHSHARAVMRHQHTESDAKAGAQIDRMSARARVNKTSLRGLIDNLRSTVRNLEWRPAGTEWGDYYAATNYSDDAQRAKAALVEDYVGRAAPRSVWDLGANTGLFSRIAANAGINTVAFDIDPAAVEKNYRAMRNAKEDHILPLLMDLTNPSTDLGWAGDERMSLATRGPADLVLALALIHHLAISNNVPLSLVAAYLRKLGRKLVIEFVPKSDSQVQRLLSSREDIFPDYTREGFEAAFAEHFTLEAATPVEGSERILYLYV
jgi:hypothetical protein